jgi:hypothetical protein
MDAKGGGEAKRAQKHELTDGHPSFKFGIRYKMVAL